MLEPKRDVHTQRTTPLVRRSFQEYLAGWHMTRLSDEEFAECREKLVGEKHLHNVCMYYCGLLKQEPQNQNLQWVFLTLAEVNRQQWRRDSESGEKTSSLGESVTGEKKPFGSINMESAVLAEETPSLGSVNGEGKLLGSTTTEKSSPGSNTSTNSEDNLKTSSQGSITAGVPSMGSDTTDSGVTSQRPGPISAEAESLRAIYTMAGVTPQRSSLGTTQGQSLGSVTRDSGVTSQRPGPISAEAESLKAISTMAGAPPQKFPQAKRSNSTESGVSLQRSSPGSATREASERVSGASAKKTSSQNSITAESQSLGSTRAGTGVSTRSAPGSPTTRPCTTQASEMSQVSGKKPVNAGEDRMDSQLGSETTEASENLPRVSPQRFSTVSDNGGRHLGSTRRESSSSGNLSDFLLSFRCVSETEGRRDLIALILPSFPPVLRMLRKQVPDIRVVAGLAHILQGARHSTTQLELILDHFATYYEQTFVLLASSIERSPHLKDIQLYWSNEALLARVLATIFGSNTSIRSIR